MIDFDALTLAGLERASPGAVWDVLPGCDTPADLPVCGSYGSVLAAVDALRTAGFAPSRFATPAPGLDGPYDPTTMLRVANRQGQRVVVVRRRARGGGAAEVGRPGWKPGAASAAR